jgi:hypothetical protein
MTRLLVLLAVVFVPSAVVAQGLPTGEANREAMKKLDFLVGKWKGEATMTLGPDRKEKFTQTEDVEYRLGGTILVVEGVGTGKLPGQDKEGVVFNAFAVMSYDAQKKEYSVRAYRAEGVSIDGYVKPADKGLVWGFKEPQRGYDIRYTVTITAKGEWNEVGEMSMDGGKTWRHFFEMTVAKAKQ